MTDQLLFKTLPSVKAAGSLELVAFYLDFTSLTLDAEHIRKRMAVVLVRA